MTELILTTSGIFFILILFYFRRGIKTIIFRFRYGEYHIKYLNLFYTEDSYYNSYYPSKSTLYNQITIIRAAIIKQEKTKTDLPLFFQNIEYGISSKKLISLIGKPVSYDVISLGPEKVVCLEYNLDNQNIVDKYVYYFRGDRYYFGEFHFNKISQETTHEILNSINLKYHTYFKNEDDFIIRNSKGNLLLYNDLGYRISISYFNENCEEINYLLNYQEEYQRKRIAEYRYQLNVKQLSF